MKPDNELLKLYCSNASRVAPVLSEISGRTDACEMDLNIGVFMDGTGNNWNWVEEGETGTQLERHKDSNIYRLFKAYRYDPLDGYFAIYVPGVGTPFEEIGEEEPPAFGMPFGAGGDGRINFALLGVLNSIRRVLSGDDFPQFDADVVKALCRNGHREYGGAGYPKPWPKGDAPALKRVQMESLGGLVRDGGDGQRRSFYRLWCDRLAGIIAARRKPKITRIVLDVFGFSRGATQARVFCTWLGEMMQDGLLCGVPAQVRFLGLFDTVASVGLSGSGHADWATAANLRIGRHVKRCVHFVAMHEQRASFPLDSVRLPDGSMPPHCQQWMFPGMHSDVGGGYTPEDQGRGPDARDDQKLSQIPLNRMYAAAVQALVPLDRNRALVLTRAGTYDPFAIHPALQQAFDAFMAAQAGPERRLREWLLPYLCWRYQQRYHYLHLPWSRRAAGADRIHLAQANREFLKQLSAFEPQRPYPDWFDASAPENAGLTPYEARTADSGLPRPPPTLEETEIFARIRKAAPTPPALATLFADYAHDSIGGFVLPVFGHEPSGYLHYRRQFMGDDRALARLQPDAHPELREA